MALLGDEALDLQRALLSERIDRQTPRTVLDILAQPETLAAVESVVDWVLSAPEERRQRLRESCVLTQFAPTQLRSPLQPRLIICSGHTYAKHVKEMGAQAPSHPVGFIKSSHTVIGPHASIVLPAKHAAQVDFEGEFAFVIGRRCHDVPVHEAMKYIAGYVLANDVSARDWVDDARRTGDMFFNTLGKQFPTFCPLGPCVATSAEIADVRDVVLTTTVNGEQMQSATLGELAFSMAELLSFWSRWYELRPGDVVTTGSPAGVGAARTPPVFLQPGDQVIVAASGVGELVNTVVSGQVQ